ncbi:hypothetical protein [Lactobacillus terrae]|uniref:hypothetical protein n=1 Tax=Lactobacillus terrae TaxID=2269374 RepID=UPI0014759652|nr:hypothetical protein [Lactobacillus terrae]
MNKKFNLDSPIYGKPSLELVLQNGDQYMELIKKVQQESAELQKDLEKIRSITPVFKTK